MLWEAPLPFPKHGSDDGCRLAVPGLREAARFWEALPSAVDRRRLASWQQRHTLGAGATQLALPSLVFVPEADQIGLFAAQAPLELSPSVRFLLPEAGAEHWLSRDDLRETVTRFIEEIVAVASASEDGRRWAGWLEQLWKGAQAREASGTERRRLRFGPAVAGLWDSRVASLGSGKAIVEGLLSDAAEIPDESVLTKVVDALLGGAGASDEAAWRRLVPKAPASARRPHEQGYDLAAKVRRDLSRGSEPIERLDVLLAELGIRDRDADVSGVFRAACCVRDRSATVVVSRGLRGVAPRRVALGAALGRILFEAKGKDWGAAVGEQSRLQETRRANAFAAELLAPSEAVRAYATDPEGLAADYGVSLTSARWRIHDVLQH